MSSICVYSNCWQELAEALGENLFSSGFSPFDEQIVIVPSEAMKRFLSLHLASHPQYQIMAGIRWKIVSSNWLDIMAEGGSFPTPLMLTLKIEALLLQTHQESPGPFSAQVSRLFLKYGLLDKATLSQWLNENGELQELWRKIFSKWLHPWEAIERSHQQYRLHIFGFHELPAAYQTWFFQQKALFYQWSPCAYFWEDLVSARDRIGLKRYFQKRKFSSQEIDQWEKYIRDTHPLLANWGKAGQNLIKQLSEHSDERYVDPVGQNCLSTIQSDLLHLRTPENIVWDSSIQIHSAPTRLREIEVLHDQVCRLLQNDPSLQPKDILILCADLDQYVPYIQMIFGSSACTVPYSIEQTSIVGKGETLEAIAYLLSIAHRPLIGRDLLQWLDFPSVAEHWGFSPQQLKQIKRWIGSAQDQPIVLDRWLMGLIVNLDEDEQFDLPWPIEGIAQTDIDLINQWVMLLQALILDLEPLQQNRLQSSGAWLDLLEGWIDRHLAKAPDKNNLLDKIHALRQSIDLDDLFFPSFLSRLSEAWSSYAGRIGALHQVQRISFLPLKRGNILPAKVIWMLGLDEEAFPRSEITLAWDSHKSPMRSLEDRYLALQALGTAQERLVISYRRVNEQDHQPQGVSRIVQELEYGLNIDLICHTIHHPAHVHKDIYLPVHRLPPISCPEPAKPSPILEQRLIIPFKSLARLARHPICFYLQQKHQFSFYNEDEADDLTVSNLKKSQFRKQMRRQSAQMIGGLRAQGQLPSGLFGDLATYQLRNEWEEQQTFLSQHKIIPQEIFSVELSLLCDTPMQSSATRWIYPALHIILSSGRDAVITGIIEDVTPQGFLIDAKGEPKDLVKYFPHQWVLALLNKEMGTPLWTQSNKTSAWEGDALLRLTAFLDYYELAQRELSILIPDWTDSLIRGSYDKFVKAVHSSIDGQTFHDSWITWAHRASLLDDLQALFDKWSPCAQKIFLAQGSLDENI